ncbi:MAG TPA: hypothetical protein VMZ49_12115 [Patescibacteria group bacterium]|nr:hypothetical protein [Patescibacteria group bacterium]
MPLDDRLNPASTTTEKQIADLERKIDELKSKYILFFSGELKLPPEKEREYIEKAVRKLIYGGAKTAKMNMIIQNLASRFSLYNNLWLKKLNELESGTHVIQKKKTFPTLPPAKREKGHREISLNLNDEDSFERLYEAYRELQPGSDKTDREKDKIIDSMKAKMLTHNLIEARVSIAIQNGKLSIKIKK